MKYIYYPGCSLERNASAYHDSTMAIAKPLGMEYQEVDDWNCCGAVEFIAVDKMQAYALTARNLALAESHNLDIITPCKCCYGSLKKAMHLLKENGSLREKINRTLGEQGLAYEGKNGVRHILQVFYHDVGADAIKKMVTDPFEGLKIAAHYGCHALRPSNIMEFDDPAQPQIFDRLVEVTGATSVDWPLKTQCCGNPLWGKNDAMSKALAEQKLIDAKQAGAEYLCVACTYCQIQFDTVQNEMLREKGQELLLPSILYPQLLGLSMGIDPEKLGMSGNILSIENISSFAQSQSHSEASAHAE